MADRFLFEFTPGPWFAYADRSGKRCYCQLDGLIHAPDLTVIFEVKLSFVPDVCRQLRSLYAPVIRLAYKPQRLLLVTVCRSYDPARALDERPRLLPDLTYGDLFELSNNELAVFPWRL